MKVLQECRCRLGSGQPRGVRSSASEPVSWDPDSPGPPFSAATALGAQWAEACAAACDLAVCSARAPVREDGSRVKQRELCSWQAVEQTGHKACVGLIVQLWQKWWLVARMRSYLVP